MECQYTNYSHNLQVAALTHSCPGSGDRPYPNALPSCLHCCRGWATSGLAHAR